MSLAQRVPVYDLRSNGGATLTWKLFTLTCQAVGIKLQLICVPVVKIWHHEQLSIGEQLVTVLASSMVNWGGFTPVAPGSMHGKANTNYSVEVDQTFVQNHFARDNMLMSKKTQENRLQWLETMEKSTLSINNPLRLNNQFNEAMKLAEGLVQRSDEASKAAENNRQGEVELKEAFAILSEKKESLQTRLRFRANVQRMREESWVLVEAGGETSENGNGIPCNYSE